MLPSVQQPIDLIKRSSWFDLLLLGLFFTPASTLAWTQILEFAGVEVGHRKAWALGFVLVHFLALALMIWGSTRYKMKYRTLMLVMGYLVSKDFLMVSFSRVREKYGDKYTDELLMDVINEFPQYVRVAKLAGGVPGVARLSKELVLPEPPDAPKED